MTTGNGIGVTSTEMKARERANRALHVISIPLRSIAAGDGTVTSTLALVRNPLKKDEDHIGRLIVIHQISKDM